MEGETLRLQFGTAATTIGTHWLAIQESNKDFRKPHVLAFEAKGRVRRHVRAALKQQEDHALWDGHVQVYDQSAVAERGADDGLWSWGRLGEPNLVEVEDFRAHMSLHNFYEGCSVANGGNIGNATLEQVEDRVRTVLETCDQLKVVQSLVDMDSSWGGLAHEVMTYIAEECPGAVTVMVGNDWSYPMVTANDDAPFRTAPEAQDRVKIEARKRVNLASSMALLSDVCHLVVPVAMSSTSLTDSAFPQLSFDRSSCADVSSVVATALEVSMSAHRGRPVHEIMEGFQSSMKVAEISASFPHTADPILLLRSICDSVANEVGRNSFMADDPFRSCSLLPVIQQSSSACRLNADHTNKKYYRRLYFRGAFAGYSSLRSAIDTCPISARKVALHWSDVVPLTLLAPLCPQTLQTSSVDAISQLELSSRTGVYLRTLAQLAARGDKRTLHEFTRAGMSPDAFEELGATLLGMSDAYVT
uniref:DML1/Misato tubulin domain-containing protein n=1 Tax=Peronospora matthiolae TaxID=2874970 RepID=A0AAV1UUD7_9STRA